MKNIRNTCLFIGVIIAHCVLGWVVSHSASKPPEVLDEDGSGLVFVDVASFKSNNLPEIREETINQDLKTTLDDEKTPKLLTAKAKDKADLAIKKPTKKQKKPIIEKKPVKKTVKKKVEKNIKPKKKPVEKTEPRSDAENKAPASKPILDKDTGAKPTSNAMSGRTGQANQIGHGEGTTGRNQGASMVRASASSCTPNYPDISKENEEEGVVTLKLTVTPSGQTDGVNVVKTSGFPRLDRAASNAMKRCLFNPALKNGKPIEWVYTQKIRFSLDDERATLN